MPILVSAETYGHTSLWGRHKFSITLHVSPRFNQRAQQSGIAKHGSPEGSRGPPPNAAAGVFSCSVWFFETRQGTWGQQEETLQSDEHHDSGLFKNTYTHTTYIYMHMCVFLMHILICSVRHVRLHEGASSINGFTVHEGRAAVSERGRQFPGGCANTGVL